MKKAPAPVTSKISVPAPNIHQMEISLVGDSPLITHKFSEKARKMMEDKQQGKAQQAKEKRDPEAEVKAALYPIPGKPGVNGFPCSAFKAAALFTCSHVDGLTKVQVKGAFHVMGDLTPLLDPISGKPAGYVRKDDPVRLRNTASVVYRPMFEAWMVRLTLRYNANVMTPEQIINLMNTAGFASGIGEWRPSSPMKSGPNGMFHVKEASS